MSSATQPLTPSRLLTLTAVLLIFAVLTRVPPQAAIAQSGGGTIAYVSPNDATGDQIRLVAPDGSNDRLIWQTGQADPSGVEGIGGLAWKPDATELAFQSNHERSCSLFEMDAFAIRPDGGGYRRITQSPACAELARYPKGTVHVPVRNSSFQSGVFYVYFQGAPGIQRIDLNGGESGSVTFQNVADFGEGQPQWAIALGGAGRWFRSGVWADVQPGGEVTTPQLSISGAATPQFGVRWLDWQRSGDRLGFVFGSAGLYQIRANPSPLEFGELLLMEGTQTPNGVDHLKWGPTAATANQFLYGGYQPTGIYLATAGSNSAGERLVELATFDTVLGLAWLPDASGFLYSVPDAFLRSGNIYLYSFATRESTPLTHFADTFAAIMSVSPDGQQIVFERAEREPVGNFALRNHDLWIMNIDGSNQRLFKENGRAPAWSLREPTVIIPQSLYLPLTRRDH